jgi:hypothetical protein
VVEVAHCSTGEFPRGRIALFQAAGSVFRRCAILTEFYAVGSITTIEELQSDLDAWIDS